MSPRIARRSQGFTLIEMVVTFVILAVLAALAMPSMSAFVRNSKIRAVSDSLQNGLRTAQSEASRRSRQVVFSLTTAKPTATGYTASANGTSWAISTVTAMSAGETSEFVEAGLLTEIGTGVTITGPASICFNALGRLTRNTAPGVPGPSCELPTAPATGGPSLQSYDIGVANPVSGVDRPLRVLVALGGQVRLCDPSRTLSASVPEGCP